MKSLISRLDAKGYFGPPKPALPDNVFRIGGDVTAPTVLYKIDPVYPEQARAAKISGTVVLYIEVDTTGSTVSVR